MSNFEHVVWAEKYRPATLDDVIIPEQFKTSLKAYIADGKVPNFIFFSQSPGTGKTTTAKAICNDLKIHSLFINASLHNSIDDIRTMVVQYATSASLIGSGRKVVILDEAERLSQAAQESLKGLIESVSKNCSFILTSNSKSKIVEPLRSRCTEVDFVYNADDILKIQAGMIRRCTDILKAENVEFELPVLVQLAKRFSPDNRKILNELQRYAKEFGKIDSGILGRLRSFDAETLIGALKAKKFDEVKQWCFLNSDGLQDDFYNRLFKTLEPVLVPQSVPQSILTLNDYQRHHHIAPDKFIHFTALCTELMMNVQFKP